MNLSSTLRWVLLALLGLTIAIGVAFVAGELTSQRIGLASEPLRAGEELAPPEDRVPRGEDRGPRSGTSTTSEAPTTTTSTDDSGSGSDDPEAADDSSGSGSDDAGGDGDGLDEDDD